MNNKFLNGELVYISIQFQTQHRNYTCESSLASFQVPTQLFITYSTERVRKAWDYLSHE